MAAELQSINNGLFITDLNDPVDFRGTGFGVLEGRCGCQVGSEIHEFTVNTWTDGLVTATPPVDLPAGSFTMFWIVEAGEPLPLVALTTGDGGILATRGAVTQLTISNPSEITSGGLYSVKLTSLPGAKPGNGLTEVAQPDGELMVVPGVAGAQPGDATYVFRSARTRNVYTHRPGEWVGGVEENGPLWTLLYGNNNLLQLREDIGEGSQTNSGTLKLSNSVASTEGVDDGKAATPAAVKAAYDYTTIQIASTVKLGGDQSIFGVKNFDVSPQLGGEDLFGSATFTPTFNSATGVTITPGGAASYSGKTTLSGEIILVDFAVDFRSVGSAASVGDVITLGGIPSNRFCGFVSSGWFPAGTAVMDGGGSDRAFYTASVSGTDPSKIRLECFLVIGALDYNFNVIGGRMTYGKA